MRIIFIALACAVAACIVPTASSAQTGYEFTLNGRTISTNPASMSGPRGCQSNLMNIETGEMVCPLDSVATPRSVWAGYVARYCASELESQSCIGGFVAVGRECPSRPQTCRYFRIVHSYDRLNQYEVSVTGISRLGNELWIARPYGDGYWRLFGEHFNSQFAQYSRRGRCC